MQNRPTEVPNWICSLPISMSPNHIRTPEVVPVRLHQNAMCRRKRPISVQFCGFRGFVAFRLNNVWPEEAQRVVLRWHLGSWADFEQRILFHDLETPI